MMRWTAVVLSLGLLCCSADLPREDLSPAVVDAAGDLSRPAGGVGVSQPSSDHQRYRRAEFPEDRTFFQWWFFVIKDLKNRRYFTFSHYLLDCARLLTNESSRIQFSMTAQQEKTAFYKVEVMPLAALKVKKHFDLVLDADPGDEHQCSLRVLDDDTYRLRGKMTAPGSAVIVDGRLHGAPVAPELPVEWDLTVRRIYGWYGQDELEGVLKLAGTIGWNTFAHASEVEGTITVGATKYTFARGDAARAYADMNWGETFPTGLDDEPAVDFPWGWYHVGRPSQERARELSIIAGVGRQRSAGLGVVEGKLMDARVDGQRKIQVTGAEIFKPSPEAPGKAVMKTNDEEVLAFRVDRDQWQDHVDSSGKHPIPLHQRVTVETTHHLVELDFYSKLEDYLHFQAVHEWYVFSDFEAMGVKTHVTVKHRAGDVLTTLHDFWSEDGGLEYGYKTRDMPP